MNLLFDLDGTLTDPKQGIVASINYALKELSFPAREEAELERFVGPPLIDTFRILLRTNDENLLMQAVELYRERYFAQGYLENYVYEGIGELLAACVQSGFKLFVATYKRQDIAVRVLEHFHLADYFDGIYGCDIGLAKAELIGQVLDEQGLTASDCMMIGDRKHDIEAGKANGMPTIGVLWGYGTLEEFMAADPDYTVGCPRELMGVLNVGLMHGR